MTDIPAALQKPGDLAWLSPPPPCFFKRPQELPQRESRKLSTWEASSLLCTTGLAVLTLMILQVFGGPGWRIHSGSLMPGIQGAGVP